MDEKERILLLEKAKDFFRDEIVDSHINVACKKAAKLSNYNVNPFLFKYLANFLKGNDDSKSIASALVLPRVLGSSINTSFGMRIQKLISELFEGYGSTTPGIDIEFIDALDGRKKYCQLKSGPNTINHDDVETIFGHFQSTINLARTNNLNIGINDMIVGVIYGQDSELSSHYKRIKERYPVIIGKDFWRRLTGKEDFYLDLIDAVGEVALEVDGTNVLNQTIEALALEISSKFS
ncbi:restriction endonuclease [Joostella atrarenae]|uniref:Restriction endonuclease n=1 Tax=Joostella atrarenae TaxID=679257 RepID=A0ABS9J095_9FLAO|nr:PmeII family type II restriction endonuclease [Joostella atrarenae]MCF8713773.1 restriction endonuclease [Joostella atrarenae]